MKLRKRELFELFKSDIGKILALSLIQIKILSSIFMSKTGILNKTFVVDELLVM